MTKRIRHLAVVFGESAAAAVRSVFAGAIVARIAIHSLNSALPHDKASLWIALPADADMHAILRELAYAAMVKRGLADADAGRTLTDDEFRKRLTAWHK